MISLSQRQNAEVRALPGASWPLSQPTTGLSPAQKSACFTSPFLFVKKKMAECWLAQEEPHFHFSG